MKKKKRSWRIYIVLFVIFTLQTLSYITLSPKSLKLQILPDYFTSLNHQSDSLYVRDFYIPNNSSKQNKHFSIQLKNHENILKKKFKVNYVHFEKESSSDFIDKTYRNYKLFYETYANRGPWYTLFGLYGANQTEILIVDQKFVYTRETKHKWILFFWIKTYEYFTIENLEMTK